MSPFHFTVYSNDAIISKTGSDNRPREFKWNLNVPITSNKYNKIAVESVFCRNIRANITNAKAGMILDWEVTHEGNVDHDPLFPLLLNTQNISGEGSGATFIIDVADEVYLRDKGLNYEVGDSLYLLNADGSLPQTDSDRTIITVKKVTRANSTTHDLIGVYPGFNEEVNANTQRMISLGNQDEKELYSIRCRYISNSYDTRKGYSNGGKIVYQGPLNFQNTNKHCFSYDLTSLDFLNGVFELCVDSNYIKETGISADIIFAITFIIMEE
jgi:hypothetical protein